LHRVSIDGTVIQVTATKTVAPSGFGWSADGRTMYGADMDGGWISRWAFDPGTSGLSHGTRIVTRGKYLAAPGGGAVDAEGSYWSCDVAAGCVSRFSPDGQVLKQILLPVPAPTTCCFGGGDMRLLFVASRRSRLGGEQLCRSPTSGGIFMVQTEVAGVPVRRFELDAGWSVGAGLRRAAHDGPAGQKNLSQSGTGS
jgi:sugar lactone lactonase YvrE